MRLAEHLHKSYTEVTKLPAWEVALWKAKERIDGSIGALGENLRHAYAPPELTAPKREQSEEEQQAQWALAVQLFNGPNKRQPNG